MYSIDSDDAQYAEMPQGDKAELYRTDFFFSD